VRGVEPPASLASKMIQRSASKGGLSAADIMIPGVPTVMAESPIRLAAAMISANPARAVVVIDADGEAVGLISDTVLADALEQIADLPPRTAAARRDLAPSRAS
jgi:CBS-domain-containing membrane protein